MGDMNRGRPRYDDILTPREWQVLALIEDGLTNEQIAERLDISFGTAKYHVAEIISKLGVERREEAPTAARQAPAPAMPFWLAWVRGRFAWPVIGAGVVAAVLLLLLSAVVFTDVLRDESTSAPAGDLSDAAADFQPGDAASQADVLTRAPAELSSFYYNLVATSEEPLMPGSPVRNMNLGTRVWYDAPDKWRVERYQPATGETLSVSTTDGETIRHYDARNGTYSQTPLDATPEQAVAAPLFGPIRSENLRTFMDQESDSPVPTWEMKDTREAILGIDALRLGQYCCRDGRVDQRMGEKTYWVDPTYNFLLRLEEKSLGTNSVILYEITDLQYNPDLDDSLFVFEPPPGVTEVPPP